jgi:LmbE family N-acetylglucosaminyl deacetylase
MRYRFVPLSKLRTQLMAEPRIERGVRVSARAEEEPSTLGAPARILVVAPHPDDELLGPGATVADAVQAGTDVTVALATAGDAYHWAVELQYGREPEPALYEDLAWVRQGETRAAMAILGIPADRVHFLGFPDGGTDQMWRTWDVPYRSPFTGRDRVYCATDGVGSPFRGDVEWEAIRTLIGRVRPDVLFTAHPWDTHGDHWATALFTRLALEGFRVAGDAWARQCRAASFLIHWGPWPGRDPAPRLPLPAPFRGSLAGVPWTVSRPSWAARRRKAEGLRCYASQLRVPTDARYLPAFIRATERFGLFEPEDLRRAPVPVVRKDPAHARGPVTRLGTVTLAQEALVAELADPTVTWVTLTLPTPSGARRLTFDVNPTDRDPRRLVIPMNALDGAPTGFLDLWQGRDGRHLAPTRFLRWADYGPTAP